VCVWVSVSVCVCVCVCVTGPSAVVPRAVRERSAPESGRQQMAEIKIALRDEARNDGLPDWCWWSHQASSTREKGAVTRQPGEQSRDVAKPGRPSPFPAAYTLHGDTQSALPTPSSYQHPHHHHHHHHHQQPVATRDHASETTWATNQSPPVALLALFIIACTCTALPRISPAPSPGIHLLPIPSLSSHPSIHPLSTEGKAQLFLGQVSNHHRRPVKSNNKRRRAKATHATHAPAFLTSAHASFSPSRRENQNSGHKKIVDCEGIRFHLRLICVPMPNHTQTPFHQ